MVVKLLMCLWSAMFGEVLLSGCRYMFGTLQNQTSQTFNTVLIAFLNSFISIALNITSLSFDVLEISILFNKIYLCLSLVLLKKLPFL